MLDARFQVALNLHRYLVAAHWNGRALMGPDPGIRFNYRMGRFIKSYLRHFRWKDTYYYLQAQGYWTLGNWELFARTGHQVYRDISVRCSKHILARQRGDGGWDYPYPGWRGRITNYEGTWASLGLLETYRHTTDPIFLSGVLQWHTFLIHTIGFQEIGDELAANYFAGRGTLRVPNNSAFVLRFLAELTDVTGDKTYLQPCDGLLTFLRRAQKATGEFPYALPGGAGGKPRPHFQCYQYNAFECLDLMRYHEITRDTVVEPLITRVLSFLCEGLAQDGHAFYECGNRNRHVTYHTAVLAAAFTKASQLSTGGCDEHASRAHSYLLRLQQQDGGFQYSRGDYCLLSDRRSYPRHLAMILYHLLQRPSIVE